MAIEITFDRRALDQFARGVENLAGAKEEMLRGLARGGEKLRTPVRRALKAQTSVKRYGSVVAKTRSYLNRDGMEYVIEGFGRGLPITDFPVRGRVQRNRDPEDQPRDSAGRFREWPNEEREKGLVTATVWGQRKTFKRSFVDPQKGFRSLRDATGGYRRLFGPAISKEIVQGQSKRAFEKGVPMVQEEVVRRLQRLIGRHARRTGGR